MPHKPFLPMAFDQETSARASRLRPVRLCFGLIAALSVSTATHASVFGEVLSVSPIGARFIAEIASPGMNRETLLNCVRLPDTRSDDGIATLSGASLSLSGAGGDARIVVTHRDPVFEPILRVTLQEICNTRLQRTYTLLMPEPAPVARPVVRETERPGAPAPSPRAEVSTAPSPGSWITAQGESVASIAQALYPRDEGARRAFVNGVIRSNPELFQAGRHPASVLPTATELRIPSLAGIAAASTERRDRPPEAAVSETPVTPARVEPVAPPPRPAPATPERDRLVVDTGARDELATGEIASDADDMTAREERLVAAIDRSIDAQLELLERIRRLEQLQAALRAQIEATALDQPITMTLPAPQTSVSPGTPVAPPSADERIPVREGPAASTSADSGAWHNWAIIGGLLALGLLLLLRRRSADATPASEASRPARSPMTEAWPEDAPLGAGMDRQRQSEETSTPDDTRPPPPPVLEWEPSPTRAAAKPPVTELSSDMPTLPPAILVEDEPEEHESAVELAEIMLSFGRVAGAAETLEAFIESNPKQAIMPWLKLMEVYHSADMHREFDILAAELNKTFNVRAVTWDNFRDVSTHGGGIEALSHVSSRLQETWGTRQCQAYIDLLVRDNRQGTRMGFELGAVDDLLMLAGVLELQLGRYKPGSS